MRIRSRRAFSASDSSPALGTRARASISLNGSPPAVGAAHRSWTSASSARERRKATSSPSGDRLTPLATGPDSDGFENTRSGVRIAEAGVAAWTDAGGAPSSAMATENGDIAATNRVEARRNVRMAATLERDLPRVTCDFRLRRRWCRVASD